MITGKVRASYAHIFEPHSMQEGQESKYSSSLIIPKSDTSTIKAIEQAIEAGEKEEKLLYSCWASIDGVWLRELEQAISNGTQNDI
ncbi:ssDNA-binding protein, partial [Staphylococcus aureus]|uniref:ssDNA-binding protein n=1 Tax=Staphylococcus aureus TaxID=1280 RepID=UPI0021098800